MFSNVTTTTRITPNFTLQNWYIGLYLSEGERMGVRKVLEVWFMNLELWGLNFKGPLGGVELLVLVAGFKLQG